MTALADIFCRGWVIVTLTACNVTYVSRGRYGRAFVTGFGISAVWWLNAHRAAVGDVPIAWLVYGLGAAVGTISGMWIGRRL